MFGASCFAGKLRSPGGPRHSQPWPGMDLPLIPTHATGVPLAWPEDCSRWSGPPRGVERPGRKERFARLIQRPVRVLGRAFGPRRLRRQSQPDLASTQGGEADQSNPQSDASSLGMRMGSWSLR